ncbi:hypothetical protein GGX14DRAFT_405794 [Mycena pura]|uniref:Uncharacterized protein n=1 Tax=Mycena pura TaxID=153505 RepID=A0AAD6Y664_9AGAR|nr:hypothetical protein GGX14DRAFT_405794 [Mycena pura]
MPSARMSKAARCPAPTLGLTDELEELRFTDLDQRLHFLDRLEDLHAGPKILFVNGQSGSDTYGKPGMYTALSSGCHTISYEINPAPAKIAVPLYHKLFLKCAAENFTLGRQHYVHKDVQLKAAHLGSTIAQANVILINNKVFDADALKEFALPGTHVFVTLPLGSIRHVTSSPNSQQVAGISLLLGNPSEIQGSVSRTSTLITLCHQEVVGVLRLSHKYEVGYLYRRALEHISRRLYFPSVEAYRASKGMEEPWDITFIGSSTEPNAQEIFTIIKVCTTVGAAWLLPMAYYYACYHIRQTDLLSMTSREDEHHSRLCLSACRDLIGKNVAAFSFLKPYSYLEEDQCVDSRRCEKVRQGLWSLVLGAVEVPLDVAPLDSFRGNIWEQLHLEDENTSQDEDEPGAFCDPCYRASKTRHDYFLQECWDKLPSFFHLPSWSELEEARQAVFGFGESTTGEMGDLD